MTDINYSQLGIIPKLVQVVQDDMGNRGLARAFAFTKDSLTQAALSLAGHGKNIGLVTGFYIPDSPEPNAETDGPLSTALLAFALSSVGMNCRVITDKPCEAVCRAALAGAGVEVGKGPRGLVTLDVVEPGSLDRYMRRWSKAGIDHMIATERPGLAHDSQAYNMAGKPIGNCVSFDPIFARSGSKSPWDTIAFGDGGNEIGMGRLPYELIARDIPNGHKIASVTGVDHLVVAGVSNWGVHALIGSLAVLRPEWHAAMVSALSPARELRTLQAMVDAGAVDGITGLKQMTVDTLPFQFHQDKTAEIVSIVDAGYVERAREGMKDRSLLHRGSRVVEPRAVRL